MNKIQLRKIFRQRRNNIAARTDKDNKIKERILNMPEIKNSDTVLIYVSCDSETDTRSIIKNLLNMNKKVAVPKCLGNGMMNFIYINSLDNLVSGTYGIPEPAAGQKAVITEKTVCIVPALSFSKNGARLGYGGGYYDRFISANNIYTIGICYDELVSDNLPCENHDVKINTLITEERMVLCCAERQRFTSE